MPFAEQHAAGADGQVQRVARTFGLLAAAGELAIAYGVLPWPPARQYEPRADALPIGLPTAEAPVPPKSTERFPTFVQPSSATALRGSNAPGPVRWSINVWDTSGRPKATSTT